MQPLLPVSNKSYTVIGKTKEIAPYKNLVINSGRLKKQGCEKLRDKFIHSPALSIFLFQNYIRIAVNLIFYF
jgi:hypothetical protein